MNRSHALVRTILKRPLFLAVSAILCGNTYGQENSGLEEIVVTSQKRPQISRDVPISLTTVDGEKIDKMGVENLEGLIVQAPNIHFTQTGLSTQMRIRGIGSDNSQGFEQSVGVYKDGIYHGRAQLFRAPMYDLERVEILRGPQSTLFGKNSIAGAIDVTTAKPTDTLQAKISGSYESEFATKKITGFASGPLNDELRGRVAFRYYDDPGYMTNTSKNRDEAQQDEQAVRVSLAWSPTNNFTAHYSAEHDTFDVLGRFAEITLDTPPAEAIPNTPFPLSFGQLLGSFSPTFAFDPELNYERQSNAPEYSNNTIDSQTLRMDYDTAAFTVTSITGLLKFDYQEKCDCDFTPANIFDLDLAEDYEQFSQEIRFVSADSTTLTWLAGAFYQKFKQNFSDTFNIPSSSLLTQVLPSLPPGFAGSGIDRQFEQNSEASALFAEGTWHIADDFHLTFGARYTHEKKDASKELNVIDVTQNNQILADPTIAGVYLAVFNTETEQAYVPVNGTPTKVGHSLEGDRSESIFTPALNIAYDINDDVMTYAKVSKGYKAGGFDPRSNVKARASTDPNATTSVSAFEFEEEEVLAYELGSKMRLAGGKAELNVAAFKMDYDDLQISQFDGKIGFNVGNAKNTVVQGLELDGRWLITDHLMSAFGFAYLDFEYKDFKNGNCYFGQSSDPQQTLCDYTGKRGVYTPEFTLNASLSYEHPITSSLDFQSNMDMQWVDQQQVHVNLDPKGEIDAYTMLALRLAIVAKNWEVALLGKNLLDEEVLTYTGNVPLSDTFAQSRTFYSFVQRPRTVALEATLHF